MALYLKYRPQNFEELVKQDHITSILKPKVASQDNTHSNYLFYWPRGTWKTSTARIFAKAINCTNLQNGNPCNDCESCISITNNKTIDVVEIDAASHTWVDNVRDEIISKAPYPPAWLKKKVYIIDEVHMLSKPAFNALLKIMEEPPHYLVFILATTEIHKVPETIISRCQIFTFKKIPVLDLKNHIQHICEKEWLTYTDEALTSIAKIADWCARDAVKYLDQVSILGDITQDHVTSFLWVASDQLMQQFLQSIITKDQNTAFQTIDSLHQTWVDINNFIKQCLVYIEEHFSENITGYIMCSDVLKRILSWLRSFPLPAILMKMEVYNMLHSSTSSTTITIQNSSPTAASTTTSTQNTQQKTPVQSKPIVSQAENTTIAEQTDTIDNNIDQIPPSKTETTKQSLGNVSNNESSLLLDISNNDILTANIKSILQKSCILDHNDENSTLYVFNKLQWSILQKPDNRSLIEKVFKQITNANHWLQIVITTKEEYLAMHL
jgi:DNA polymerase III subunit gamma/tau